MQLSSDKKTILLIERDVLVRMVIAAHLRTCGYRVIEGASPQDVWTLLSLGEHVDVVFARLQGSGEPAGFELATRIRQTHPRVDVMLATGVNGAAEKSTTLCDNGPLAKTYSSREVEARIKSLLERRGV